MFQPQPKKNCTCGRMVSATIHPQPAPDANGVIPAVLMTKSVWHLVGYAGIDAMFVSVSHMVFCPWCGDPAPSPFANREEVSDAFGSRIVDACLKGYQVFVAFNSIGVEAWWDIDLHEVGGTEWEPFKGSGDTPLDAFEAAWSEVIADAENHAVEGETTDAQDD